MNLIAIFFLTIMANAAFSNAFTVSSIPRAHVARFGESTQMNMGFFDGIAKAFGNEEYGAPPDAVKATARHILVKTEADASMVMEKLSEGSSSFAELAREYSTCPSGSSSGGSLGSFQPGTMVPEFDKVIFSPDTVLGTVIGPVETKFGYHLIVVDKRTGGGDWY